MPFGAITVTLRRPVSPSPVFGSRTCEYRTPLISTNCSRSPDVETAAFASFSVRGFWPLAIGAMSTVHAVLARRRVAAGDVAATPRPAPA